MSRRDDLGPGLVSSDKLRLDIDIDFGYVGAEVVAPRRYNLRLVLNGPGTSVGHAILEELRRCDRFTFSVASISSAAIVQLRQHVKKDDVESDHCYLGTAAAHDATETTMPSGSGEPLPVVTMTPRFDEPISQGLFDYFRPAL